MESKASYSSFEEMYLDNYKLVYLFTRDYISDGFLVQDISSTVWTKVAEHLEKCMAMEKLWFRNYLKIMVRNTVVDHYREEKAIHELQKNIQDVSNSNCGYSTAECEEKEYLREAVTILSDEERQLLYFKYEMNMRSEEIGEALGISAGAVRMRHKRTVEKLRKEINRLRADDGDMPL